MLAVQAIFEDQQFQRKKCGNQQLQYATLRSVIGQSITFLPEPR